MEDGALENLAEAAGEVLADKALGPDMDTDPLSRMMAEVPGPLRFAFKASVGLLAGAPVFAMTKLARRLQRRARR